MKIILFSGKDGDRVIAEISVIEEAEQILREYRSKGCFISTGTDEITALKEPLPAEVIIVFPMAGG